MVSDKKIPELRLTLFWDLDAKQLDFDKHKDIIIERVSTRGLWTEFKQLLEYYGEKQIVKTLKNVRYLDKKTLSFISAKFKIPLSEFRCYKIAQSNPEHWNY